MASGDAAAAGSRCRPREDNRSDHDAAARREARPGGVGHYQPAASAIRHLVARMQSESSYVKSLAETGCLENMSNFKGLAYPCNNAAAASDPRRSRASARATLRPRLGT